MTEKHKDIWDQIEEQRASYAWAIGKATDTINAARKLIAEAREGMDALPVAKVRRPRKRGDNVSAEAVTIDEVVSGGKS